MKTSSSLGRAYDTFYGIIAGFPPNNRPWHFQWLTYVYQRRELKHILSSLGGKILDVGCGKKPYKSWFSKPLEAYVGIDITPGDTVDLVIDPTQEWDLKDNYFDVVLCTQVLEHVVDLNLTLSEIDRVLKPGGIVLFTFPFLYNEHGIPHDYRRFTRHSASHLMTGYEVAHLSVQGGIGSTVAILFLNWIEDSFNLNKLSRLLKAVFLPFWLLISFLLNLLAYLLDRLDRTTGYYNNVLILLKKPKS